MRLCLDEHYASRIAVELRGRGHDACAVEETPELRGLSDGDLWRRMQEGRRALVTENVADFTPLLRDAALAGEDHWGIVFTSPRSLPRAAATSGRFVELLDDLMKRHAGEGEARNRVHWLTASPE